jgi:hypothetical protein
MSNEIVTPDNILWVRTAHNLINTMSFSLLLRSDDNYINLKHMVQKNSKILKVMKMNKYFRNIIF